MPLHPLPAVPTPATHGAHRATLLRRRPALSVFLALALAVLATPVLALTSLEPAHAKRASLSVKPGQGDYVGGQLVTFSGNIGMRGKRRVRLQFNGGGGSWTDLNPGRTWRTRRTGRFSFKHPAPAMFNIRYRVATKGGATPAVRFDARSQDVVLSTRVPGLPEGHVVAGEPFPIQVDTTPRLAGRPDLPGPEFPGRRLTLQRRLPDSTWQTLARTTTDRAGEGLFTRVVADGAGEAVYRVRQEDLTRNGNRIGWFPSFPTYVRVSNNAASARTAAAAVASREASSDSTPVARVASGAAARAGNSAASAALRHGWRPALFDFAWEFGESLTSKPMRGTQRRGRWVDAATGTGRAVHYNGGLMLDSQRDGSVNRAADESWGATSATLRGQARRTGRWETRLRVKSFERDDADAVVRLELVPEDPADQACGARAITVAQFVPGRDRVTMGARTPRDSRQWTRSIRGVPTQDRSNAYAVELGRRHITWFWNGKPVASTRARAALPKVPMTLRLSLSGPEQWSHGGAGEFNRTRVISDWQRGYSLGRGKQVGRGPRMSSGKHGYRC